MKNLVLLHGWGADSRVWQKQLAAFGNRLQVLAPAIDSWEPPWLSAFLGRLSLAECLLVGWSLGGMLLLQTLAEVTARPGGLVLVGVSPVFCRRPDYPWGQPAAGVRAMRRALKDNHPEVLKGFAHRCLASGEEVFREKVAAFFRPADSPENLTAGLDYLLHQDLRPYLDRVSGKPVIIQGEQDNIVAVGQAQFLYRQLPDSRLYLLPGAGHLPFLTQAAAFNEILEDILRGGLGERGSPTLPSNSTPTPR